MSVFAASHVTPATADMKEMERCIRTIEMDGLLWGQEFKVVDVAFGIQKLIIQAVVEDEKVSLDELEEKILAFEEIVQSLDQTAMNKVS